MIHPFSSVQLWNISSSGLHNIPSGEYSSSVGDLAMDFLICLLVQKVQISDESIPTF